MFIICSFGTVADQATWHAYYLAFRMPVRRRLAQGAAYRLITEVESIMKDFTKNEETDMALGLDALSQVPGGVKMPTGGTVLHFPDHWLFVAAHAVSRHTRI